MQNFKKFYAYGILDGLIALLLGGSVLQTVLLESGFSENTVNIYISVMQLVQILTIFLFSKQSDKIKSIKSTQAKIFLLKTPIALIVILMCFFKSNSIFLMFLILASISFFIASGIQNILCYKLPYKIMPMLLYGRASALSGMFSGIVCLAVSFILMLLQKSFDFFKVMSGVYIISISLPIICYWVINSFEENNYNENISSNETKQKLNFFKYKPFFRLIFANLARGFCLGIISMAITIGYYTDFLDANSASYLIIISNVINITSPLVYSFISGKISEKFILLFSSIMTFIFMPLMLLGKSTAAFLLFYCITYFFINIINYAVPVAVVKIADYEIMGQYSAGRMLLNTLGTSLAGFACIPMFKLFGPLIPIVISAALQLFSGFSYYLYMKKNSI